MIENLLFMVPRILNKFTIRPYFFCTTSTVFARNIKSVLYPVGANVEASGKLNLTMMSLVEMC